MFVSGETSLLWKTDVLPSLVFRAANNMARRDGIMFETLKTKYKVIKKTYPPPLPGRDEKPSRKTEYSIFKYGIVLFVIVVAIHEVIHNIEYHSIDNQC